MQVRRGGIQVPGRCETIVWVNGKHHVAGKDMCVGFSVFRCLGGEGSNPGRGGSKCLGTWILTRHLEHRVSLTRSNTAWTITSSSTMSPPGPTCHREIHKPSCTISCYKCRFINTAWTMTSSSTMSPPGPTCHREIHKPSCTISCYKCRFISTAWTITSSSTMSPPGPTCPQRDSQTILYNILL